MSEFFIIISLPQYPNLWSSDGVWCTIFFGSEYGVPFVQTQAQAQAQELYPLRRLEDYMYMYAFPSRIKRGE